MINALPNFNNIDKIIGKTLETQSGLSKTYINNAKSNQGVDLSDNTNKEILARLAKNKIDLIFDNTLRISDNNISAEYEDNKLLTYQACKCHVVIYGNDAPYYATLLKSRFESEKCRQDLYAQGIYLEDIQLNNSINEFINDTMWTRADFDINFSVRLDVTQISHYEDFDVMNDINVINSDDTSN